MNKSYVDWVSLSAYIVGSQKGESIVFFYRIDKDLYTSNKHYHNPSKPSLRRLYRAVENSNSRVIIAPSTALVGWLAGRQVGYVPRQGGE